MHKTDKTLNARCKVNIVEEKNNKRICKVIVYIPFGTDSIGIREALLRVHGPSTEIKFVQGIIANDIERASKCIIDCNSKDTYVYFPGCKVCEQQILKLSELGNNFFGNLSNTFDNIR